MILNFKDCHLGYLDLRIYSPIKLRCGHIFQWYWKTLTMTNLNSHVGYRILRSHSPQKLFIALGIGLLLKSNTVSKFKTEICFRQHNRDLIKMIFDWKKSHFMIRSWHGNAYWIYGPLWGKWTDHQWFPSQWYIWSFDVISLAWTNYLTNSQVAKDHILVHVSLWGLTALVTCASPSQTDSAEFQNDVFFVVCLNRLLNKFPEIMKKNSSQKFDIKANRLLHWSTVDSCPKSPVICRLDVFFVVCLNELLNKQSSCWRFLDQLSVSQAPCEENPSHKLPVIGKYCLS